VLGGKPGCPSTAAPPRGTSGGGTSQSFSDSRTTPGAAPAVFGFFQRNSLGEGRNDLEPCGGSRAGATSRGAAVRSPHPPAAAPTRPGDRHGRLVMRRMRKRPWLWFRDLNVDLAGQVSRSRAGVRRCPKEHGLLLQHCWPRSGSSSRSCGSSSFASTSKIAADPKRSCKIVTVIGIGYRLREPEQAAPLRNGQ
jgi:hypothetical protein